MIGVLYLKHFNHLKSRVSSGIYIICVQTTSQEILEKLAVVR